MKAVKENKIYTVDENSAKNYQAQGFDIYDENGKLVGYGANKKVTYEEYVKVKNELEELKKNSNSEAVEILKLYANERGIELGNSTSIAGIVKKIKDSGK